MLTFQRLAIPDVQLITPMIYTDERGFFMETYKKSVFAEHGINEEFVQRNQSSSKKYVLRGLHFQTGEYAQGKLVSCGRGEIFDVAVDIRAGSKTFGKYVSAILSDKNFQMLYIPAGFAHGFYTLSEEAEVVYLTSCEYKASAEAGIIWNDPTINISWSTATMYGCPTDNGGATTQSPILSEKDASYPQLLDSDVYKEYLLVLRKL